MGSRAQFVLADPRQKELKSLGRRAWVNRAFRIMKLKPIESDQPVDTYGREP
jgi:hypothetical protein